MSVQNDPTDDLSGLFVEAPMTRVRFIQEATIHIYAALLKHEHLIEDASIFRKAAMRAEGLADVHAEQSALKGIQAFGGEGV